MALTLLQVVDQAAGEMGVQQPSTVISNTTLYVIQMLNLTNGLIQNLGREHDWQRMLTYYQFTTVYYQYTATLSTSSTTITAMSSTTGLTSTPTYFTVLGTGIPQNTTLVSVNGGASTAVLSNTPTTAGTVTLTFAQTQYALPADYDRLIDRTDWSNAQRWELLGPETPQQWAWLTSSYIATGPRIRWRLLANTFQIWPPQAANLPLSFQYLSNFAVATSASAAPSKALYTVDTDVSIFPDSLMVTGLKWRWAKEKENPSVQMYEQDFMRELNIAKTADAGSPTLAMAPQPASVLLTWNNIPDSQYNL